MNVITKIWRSSRFFVILYALVLLLGMVGMLFNFKFPLDSMALYWPMIISVYTVFDRFVDVKNTMNLPKGSIKLGDLAKLRFVIFLCLLLFGISWYFTKETELDFQMAEFGAAFAASIITYIGGNKIVKGYKFSGPDKDKDGIPDSIQEEYYRWEREQKKEGVESDFINLEYFLDSHEELRKKL